MAKEFKRYLVTSALPYANGPVHIGHLAGVYIPSDIYTRYLRLRGRDVISVCGSDEHGVPITIKARKEGVTPQQIVDEISEERSDIKVGKINVDEQMELAQQFRIVSIPTLVVMKDGQIANKAVGAMPKEDILALL